MKSLLFPVCVIAAISGCRDIDKWSSRDGRFEGKIVASEFVRSGIAADTRMCLVLDTTRLEEKPGAISTSDGRFVNAPLVPMTKVLHDPLSTLSFGSGRAKNVLFGARPNGADAGVGEDVLVIVSLMESSDVEVRFLRASGGADPAPSAGVFAVFPLARESGPCSFSAPSP